VLCDGGQNDHRDHGDVRGEQWPNSLQVGDLIDRFGEPNGNCASPFGDPYPKRAPYPPSITRGYEEEADGPRL
jgi:hypothetical protein